MNFTSQPEDQWRFILAAVAQAASDAELTHIAGGPVEHLLGHHRASRIDHVELNAAANPKFARMLSSVCKHMMSDDVWARVQALQARSDGSPAAEASR
ncbi:MAG: hypothetical protein KF774_19935 [Planctomyces sp.]|nr:hypothetical protein [Planctomyces sp.]